LLYAAHRQALANIRLYPALTFIAPASPCPSPCFDWQSVVARAEQYREKQSKNLSAA
jgi:hypothetical protein